MRIDPMLLIQFLQQMTWDIDFGISNEKNPPDCADGSKGLGAGEGGVMQREKPLCKSSELDEVTLRLLAS